MTTKQRKKRIPFELKARLGNWTVPGCAPVLRLRSLRDAVEYAAEHGLSLPEGLDDHPLARVFRRQWEDTKA